MEKRNFMSKKSLFRNYRQIGLFVKAARLHNAKKKAPKGAFFLLARNYQSLLPPPIPSSMSKLWKTLNALKYRERVAVM